MTVYIAVNQCHDKFVQKVSFIETQGILENNSDLVIWQILLYSPSYIIKYFIRWLLHFEFISWIITNGLDQISFKNWRLKLGMHSDIDLPSKRFSINSLSPRKEGIELMVQYIIQSGALQNTIPRQRKLTSICKR